MKDIQAKRDAFEQVANAPVLTIMQHLIEIGTPYVLPFSAISALDLPVVGGKGANLGEMGAAGFPVPPGFCVTTRAFWLFLLQSQEAESIYALLEAVDLADLESVRKVGKEVRRRLAAAPMPEDVVDAVRTALG